MTALRDLSAALHLPATISSFLTESMQILPLPLHSMQTLYQYPVSVAA